MFLPCRENNDVDQTDKSARKTGPEGVDLKMIHKSASSAPSHGHYGSTTASQCREAVRISSLLAGDVLDDVIVCFVYRIHDDIEFQVLLADCSMLPVQFGFEKSIQWFPVFPSEKDDGYFP